MAETTIVPFSALPSCAASCGPLYDVNGKCVPPNTAAAAVEVYQQCFCSDDRLAVWSTTTAGPCDAACAATPDAYGSMTSWYQSMCSSVQALVATVTTDASGATTTVLGSATSTAKSSGGHGGGWLSNHWQWVIFIVIMVVGIAGIWIGAAVWRRHYLRKKDRQYSLGKNLAQRTGSGQNPYGGPMGRDTPTLSGSVRGAGGFKPGTAATDASTFGEKSSVGKKLFRKS